MGLYERDYTQDHYRERYHSAPQMQFGFLRITKVVKWLLIINTVIFVISYLNNSFGYFTLKWFSVFPVSIGYDLQIWRLVTYQFLHKFDEFGHIFGNMLVLFFFGPLLESSWGSRKFLTFYLFCGAAGGVLYPFLVHIGWLDAGPLIGASGAILGILAACAVLFPRMRVYVMGIFPVRIVLLVAIFTGIAILTLLRPDKSWNAGGEAAHLAGLAAGAAYVLWSPSISRLKLKARTSRWRKKMAERQRLITEVDRILQKVHDSGINSLTRKEKSILKKATESEKVQDRL